MPYLKEQKEEEKKEVGVELVVLDLKALLTTAVLAVLNSD